MKNRAVFKLIMISIAISCGLSSCSSDDDGGNANDFTATPISLTSDESSIVNNVNDYSLSLFSKVNADYQRFNNGNVFISPLSSEFALAMTANGADGNTLTEILTALNGGNTTLSSINSLNKKLITGLPRCFPA
jgi:serpin B